MTFAAPLFLLATLAGIIPVILHMISSRRAPEHRFSTLRFLRVSVQRTRRRKRVHDLLLLLVRVAALVLIAVGLAKPAITSLSSILGGSATRAVAIVLDNSASMALVDEGRPRFETATHVAERILDELSEGDSVALVLTGGPPLYQQDQLYHTHETVREMLAQSRVSYERADLPARIQQARKLLAESDAPNKELYVITDGQAISWGGTSEASSESVAESAADRDDVPVILVDVQRQAAPNVALRTVQIETPVRAVGVPVTAVVELFNASPVPQQQHVDLYLDGNREQASPTLSIPPLQSTKHEFRFAFSTAGVYRGEVRLGGDDASALDNRLFFAVTIDQQIPVAILKPRRHEIEYLDDSYYLEQALSPSDGGGWAIRATTLTVDEIATEPLSGYSVVFCVNLPALEPPARDRLRDYAAGGGRIVWTCGENVQAVAYNQMNDAAGGQLLPARLADAMPRPDQTQPENHAESRHISFLDSDHPALAKLTEPASVYQSVLVHRHVPVDPREHAAARVLARLDNGQPLLVERTIGSGRVLWFGTSVHTDWTNLPLKPLFLPLFARLTFHLAGSHSENSQLFAGAPITVPLSGPPAPAQLEVLRPTGESLRVNTSGESSRTFSYADTHEVGVYVIRPLDGRQAMPLAFAVNLDPDECDPAAVTPAELKSRFGPQQLVVCENPENIAATIRRLRQGESLWELFLSVVLVALVVESFLANRLVPRAPQPVPIQAPRASRPAEQQDEAVLAFLEQQANRM